MYLSTLRTSFFSSLAAAVAGAAAAAAEYSTLAMDATPDNFFEFFDFRTDEPTLGHTQYQTHDGALELGLISQRPLEGHVYIGVDYWAVAPDGRPSVRIESKDMFTHGLFLMDVEHMPYGCGVWPAVWTYGVTGTWPEQGEIDIIEGVHNALNNTSTIHLPSGNCSCTVTPAPQEMFTGKTRPTYCTTKKLNQYISTTDSLARSFGTDGWEGGIYAMEWTKDRVRTWFFERNAVPADALEGEPNPENWGTPMSNVETQCGMENMKDHKLIINTTFCGIWAGKQVVWDNCGCADLADTCAEFVANNPDAFEQAHWKIRSLRVWSE